MEALFVPEPGANPDSLDLVERIMALEEELGIEVSEDDCERWRNGEWPDTGWLQGSPVLPPGPFPSLSGGAEADPSLDEEPEEDSD